MKTRTKVVAWFWMALGVATLATALLSALTVHPPGEPQTGLGDVGGVAALVTLPLLLCGVGLLRHRAWAWWVLVVFSGLGSLAGVWCVVLTHSTAAPGGLEWPWLMRYPVTEIVYLLTLLALLTDPPGRWRPTQPREAGSAS